LLNSPIHHATWTPRRRPDESLPTRASLLSRLHDLTDSDSWRAFFETYWRLLYNVARKSGLNDVEAQDVVQETVIAVARKMPEFRYDPAKGFFQRVAVADHEAKDSGSSAVALPFRTSVGRTRR
jgi:Sigma-70 region 2